MNYANDELIPIPREQRWKDFRLKVLPVVVFLVVGAVVIQLWSVRVTHANMTGVVVGNAAEISSPTPGVLTLLDVERFQQVAEGDVIGRVITTDPQLLEARLGIVLAEVRLLSVGGGDAAGQQRALLNRGQLEMELMRGRVELAASELRHQQLEREIGRLKTLFEQGIITTVEYERAESELAVRELEIEQNRALIDEMRGRLEQMPTGQEMAGDGGPIAAAMRRQEEELRLIEAESMPVILIAPFDGMITRVFRSNGERVAAEEPILLLRSPQAQYVVGYLPQPLRLQPQVGMTVTIRARSHATREFSGKVVGVGVQIETMEELALLNTTPSIASEQQQTSINTGLPVKIALAEGSPSLRPGELVQLTLRSAEAAGTVR